MKKILRKILPVSVFRRIKTVWRRARYYVNLCIIKVKVLLHIPLKRKRTAIRFEVHLAEHCNLNCKACNNFSCIAAPEFADIEEFRRDMKMLGEIFRHECEKSCHDNNIDIIVSPYPIRLNKDRIRALAGQYGAALRMADSRDQFYIQPVNLEGNSDVNVNFGLCVRANACISLSHGIMIRP